MGTNGVGVGLDDPHLEPLWGALSSSGLMTFLHPHYGVGNEHFRATGHVLALALGFPFEVSPTTASFCLPPSAASDAG